MPALLALPPRPGIFIEELTAGANPPAIALYQRNYLLGTASKTDAPIGVPTAIGSMDDFTNQFGSSSAIILDSIEAYLTTNRQGLFYVRVTPSPIATITVGATTAGTRTVTIAGTAITYTVPAGATVASIIDGLVTAINDNTTVNTIVEAEQERDAVGASSYTNSRFVIRSKSNAVFTLTTSAELTASTVAAPAAPRYWDWLRAVRELPTTQATEPLGFLTCPEAFFSATATQFERTQVGNAMEIAARALGWYAPIDPGNPSAIVTGAQAVTDAAGYTAVRGHSAYYFPYCKNQDGDAVSPAVMLAAIGLRRYEVEGIHQPPAGTRYPLDGVGGLYRTLSTVELDLLATNRINPVIFKRGIGYVVYDTLTRATDTNFRHINTRVILSCLERSIQDTVDASGKLFEAIGGRGLFFIQLRNIIEQVVARFYAGNALYGVLPGEAYTVKCDASMQEAADLEAGIVTAEVYVVPAATARRIRITVFRVQIGRIAEATGV